MNQTEAADERGLLFWMLFWAPGVLGLGALLLHLFKEQLNELRTLRFLTNQLAPYFPEFDIEQLQRWVALCAPHVWHGQRRRDFSTLAGFATPALLDAAHARFEAEARRGERFDGTLDRVLKIHTLGLRHAHSPAAPEPPPAGVELVLRVELLASDARRAPDDRVLSGRPDLHQLQQFWTLRHDGRQWRLHALEPADRERRDLPRPTDLPGLMEWKKQA
jgi:hypothetical protein